ncbi:MAG: sulfite exporter TauE/SafE family protein [Desulfobacterales bacterium]|nr:sulfite exporter TauE/SafE family protein [Desulfobacterales bacterium]
MFLLGLFGSGHCLGMCGPLIVALPGAYGQWRAHFLYHAGRLFAYAVVGALLGGAGQGLIGLADLPAGESAAWTARLQVMLSLPVALFLLLFGLHRLGMIPEPAWMAKAMPRKLPGFDRVMRRVLDRRGALWLAAMGALLGLLPCGLSYGAFARAITAGSVLQGAFWTSLFGLGTLPALLLLGGGAATLWQRFRPQAELLAGLIMVGMAVTLLGDAWIALC